MKLTITLDPTLINNLNRHLMADLDEGEDEVELLHDINERTSQLVMDEYVAHFVKSTS